MTWFDTGGNEPPYEPPAPAVGAGERIPRIVVVKVPLLLPRLIEFRRWYRLRGGSA